MRPTPTVTEQVAASTADSLRRFNRFYTPLIGSLARAYLGTEYTLQEARTIFEVATRPGCTAKEVQSQAGFDQAYLSRLIARLTKAGIIRRVRSQNDQRAQKLFLTRAGMQAFRTLDDRANVQARQLLSQLGPEELAELGGALHIVRHYLDRSAPPEPIIIRGQRAGDLGWVFQRHGEVYREEFGYSDAFESYVCEGLAPFIRNFDPKLDKLWIGQMGERRVGSVAVHHVKDRPGWAKLRWFLVEREARRKGLGSKLLNTALTFSRKAGYSRIFLWTVSDLDAARRLYERKGFSLAKETKSCPWASWAHEQRWELLF